MMQMAPICLLKTDAARLALVEPGAEPVHGGAQTVVRAGKAEPIPAVFAAWLDNHLPSHKHKILSRVADMRGATGRLNDSDFHSRFKGTGIIADTIATTFKAASHKHGFTRKRIDLSTAAFRRPAKNQPELF